MNRINFLKFWSITVGSMDTITGFLLIAEPVLVLRMLGIAPPSADALVFLSWMGVFIMGIGLSYAMALGRRSRGETVWAFTAMVRIMVALFILLKILGGDLPLPWGIVGVSDAMVGVIQIMILRLGWWKEVRR